MSVEFQIGRDHPLVTLVAMIAPSPDWFVGVHDLGLIESGDWVDEMTVDLLALRRRHRQRHHLSGAQLRHRAPRAHPVVSRARPWSPGALEAPFGTLTFVRLPS